MIEYPQDELGMLERLSIQRETLPRHTSERLSNGTGIAIEEEAPIQSLPNKQII